MQFVPGPGVGVGVIVQLWVVAGLFTVVPQRAESVQVLVCWLLLHDDQAEHPHRSTQAAADVRPETTLDIDELLRDSSVTLTAK